jgi:hypothetical protein
VENNTVVRPEDDGGTMLALRLKFFILRGRERCRRVLGIERLLFSAAGGRIEFGRYVVNKDNFRLWV